MNTEKIAALLKLAFRQETALNKLLYTFKNFFNSGLSFKRIIASFMIIAECIGCIIFDSPVSPSGQELDLSEYKLVFEDEFNGNELNSDNWYVRGNGPRRSGFNASSQVSVKDGNLVIAGEYLENGEYGPGWYVAAIGMNEYYSYGYYEIKCICNKGKDFWSAFWIQSPNNPYDHNISQGGVNGAEIDIFESAYPENIFVSKYNYTTSTVHCNGWDDDKENIDSRMIGKFKTGNDICSEYNTFGLEWTEDEYIFYINGVETGRTSFGKGVSKIPEQVLVSLEIPDKEIEYDKDYKTEFIVDYVRYYQKNPNK